MPLNPPLCLYVLGNTNPYINTNGVPNYYGYTVTLQSAQQYALGQYNLKFIKTGMYISTDLTSTGSTWRIVSFTSNLTNFVDGTSYTDGTDGEQTVDLIIEDVNNYNALLSIFNIGNPADYCLGYIYELNSIGLPILSSIPNAQSAGYGVEQISRFLGAIEADGPDVKVSQPGNTLKIADTIYYDSSSNTYKSSNNSTNAKYSIGLVTKIGIPNSDSFTYAPFGTYYNDISNYFTDTNTTTNILSLAAIPDVVPGSIIYIDTTGTSQYTLTAPTDTAIPIWIYLGLDPVTGKETGILMPFGGSGSGGSGGSADLSQIVDADPSGNILTKKITLDYSASKLTITGIGSTFLLKASKAAANFDFQNANVIMSSNFGTTYTPRYVLDASGNLSATPTDGTGFMVTLNPKYTMANIPMIIGTVTYWAGTFMIYSQLKFGSSTGTTNSAQALLIPSNPLTSTDASGNLTYGAPLKLSIAGLSVTSGALGSARNISTTAPLNYAMQVYLEILN